MNRKELLSWFHSLPFNYIDAESDWEDIGFTERPIWVNSKGYGFLSCDDPSEVCWEGAGVPQEKWAYIREKIRKGELLYSDIQATSLIDLINEVAWETFEPDDNITDYLAGLLSLPEEELKAIYAMNSWDGWCYFSNEESFERAYERDWCDVAWDELDDNALTEWYKRLK